MESAGGLIHCIYASSGAPEFHEADIPALLQTTRENNARLDVTGMLLYVQGSFFQVLEGPAEKVDPHMSGSGRRWPGKEAAQRLP
jgi:hypothetical protein